MSGACAPQIEITVGGIPLPCTEAEIALNNQLEAGSFSIVAPVGGSGDGAPLLSVLEPVQGDAETLVEIRMAVAGPLGSSGAWTLLLSGSVDQVVYDPFRGLLELEGRDHIARLISLPVEQDFINRTASDIVAALAQSAGLTPVAVPTSALVGQFYQIDHAHSALATQSRFATAWDLVASLAQDAGYDCWVAGETLFFQPSGPVGTADLLIDVSGLPFSLGTGVALGSLRLHRRMELFGGKGVSVASWNSRQRAVVSASYPSATPKGTASLFRFVVPNLDSAAAFAKAQALYQDMRRHRQVLSGEMVGDLTLMPRGMIELVGTGGAWDGIYVVDSVVREISADGGFRQSFVAHLY